MNDEQLAARRAQIPVHCAACGGEFPGTTQLHNGICDDCHKLTHGPNYRLIAELNRKAEELERCNVRIAELLAETARLKRLLAEDVTEIERLRVRLKHAESFIHERHRAGYEAAVREEIDHG